MTSPIISTDKAFVQKRWKANGEASWCAIVGDNVFTFGDGLEYKAYAEEAVAQAHMGWAGFHSDPDYCLTRVDVEKAFDPDKATRYDWDTYGMSESEDGWYVKDVSYDALLALHREDQQGIALLREALENLVEAVPNQNNDRNWWPDELTHAMRQARKVLGAE